MPKNSKLAHLTLLLLLPSLFVVAQPGHQQQAGQFQPEVAASWPAHATGNGPYSVTSAAPLAFHPNQSPTVNSGSNTYWVGGRVSIVNSGVRGTIQVQSQSVVGCLSYWVSDDSATGIWGQVGYYICSGSTPIAFYQIWNLNTNTVLVTGTTSVSTGFHQFSIYLQSGTTWAYALDGMTFGTYNMGASLSNAGYPVYALSEEGYVSGAWNPAQVEFSTAIQVMEAGVWSSVQTATSYGNSWGLAGNHQDVSLPNDAMLVGGSMTPLSPGTLLWNLGIAPSTTTVTPNPSSVTVSNQLSFTATVTDTSASPTTPTGTVSWSDGGKGGSFNPSSCTLAAASSSSSTCSTTYKASSTAGPVTITASYSGDSSHSASSGISSLTVNPQSSVQLAIDGTGRCLNVESGLSCTATLTTSKSPDVLYCQVGEEDIGRASPSPSVSAVTDNKGNAWSRRVTTTFTNGAYGNDAEGWYTTWSSSGSISITVTVAASAASHSILEVLCFGVSGANTATPFDPNVSIPASSSSSSHTNSGSVTISTSGVNDLLITELWLPAADVVAPSGFTIVNGAGGSQHMGYSIVSSTQSSKTETWSFSGCNCPYGIVFDAIQQAPG